MGFDFAITTGHYDAKPRRIAKSGGVENLWETLVHMPAPSVCASCKRFGSIICYACWHKIKEKCTLDFPLCFACEKLCISGATHKVCVHSTPIKRFFCPYQYISTIKGILKAKARNISAIRELLSDDCNLKLACEMPLVDLIIPIPSTFKLLDPRLIEPTIVISEYISKRMDVPITKVLAKSILAKTQKKLDSSQRSSTKLILKSEFKNKLTDKIILLVDDICTTGSTLNSAAKLLSKHGAGTIFAYSLARDLRYNMQ